MTKDDERWSYLKLCKESERWGYTLSKEEERDYNRLKKYYEQT